MEDPLQPQQPQLQAFQASPSNQPPLYKASVLRRFGATVIDVFVLLPVYGVLTFVASLVDAQSWSQVLFGLLSMVYYVYFISTSGATLGKKWLKVTVVSTTGAPVTVGQAILRETVGKFLSGFVLNLGYLWAIWDKNRQTWHDKIANTYVVTPIPNDGKNSPWLFVLLGLGLVLPTLGILAAVVLIAINPLSSLEKTRDARRLSDVSLVNSAILASVSSGSNLQLCPQGENYCEFTSAMQSPTVRNTDGTGWVPVDLSEVLSEPLPIEPKQSVNNYYKYCSDGVDWEINTALENRGTIKTSDAGTDDGNDPFVYEVGSKLTVCQ